MSLSHSDKSFYNRLLFLSSISLPSSPPQIISQSDLFQICQYIQPFMLTKSKTNLTIPLTNYRNKTNQDTCLHIAAKAGNKKLVQYLLQSNINDANSLNIYKQTPLMSVLRYGQDMKSDKIAYILSKKTNIKLRNIDNQRAFEISQGKMDPSRAKLLQHLKNLAARQ